MSTRKTAAKFSLLLAPNVFLGLALIISATVFGFFFYRSRQVSSSASISVNGSASQIVVSDSATWNIEFEQGAKDMKKSLEYVKNDERKVRDFLKDAGFDDKNLSETEYSTSTQYHVNEDDTDSKEVSGYRTVASIVIETDDVEKMSKAFSMTNELVLDGVNLGYPSPQYYYSGLSELKLELLDDAMANARKRAEIIAEGDDAEIEELNYASQGVFQVNAVGDKSVSDYGNFDTSSIKKEVVAVVSASFSSE